ncbi:hypothetical protein AVEN_106590-1, partial [Araneus ventricosus]
MNVRPLGEMQEKALGEEMDRLTPELDDVKLVSPLITRSCVSVLCAWAPDMEDLADYGFLYGMVPTGPIVMLFAAEYGLGTEM